MTPVGVAGPVERAVEVKQLSAVLAAAAGGRGQTCVIEGPSGVGKSRLLDECAGMAAALEMNVLRARGSELTRDYQFGVVRHLFEARVDRGEMGMRAKLMRGQAALAEPVFGQGGRGRVRCPSRPLPADSQSHRPASDGDPRRRPFVGRRFLLALPRLSRRTAR
jgi:AAA ATPase domain